MFNLETQVLSLQLLSLWLVYIITKYWDFYLLNIPQIFYPSPSPASLPRTNSSCLSLTGSTTTPSLLAYQHQLLCWYLAIIPVSPLRPIWSFQNIIWPCQHHQYFILQWLHNVLRIKTWVLTRSTCLSEIRPLPFSPASSCTIFPFATTSFKIG